MRGDVGCGLPVCEALFSTETTKRNSPFSPGKFGMKFTTTSATMSGEGPVTAVGHQEGLKLASQKMQPRNVAKPSLGDTLCTPG